MPTVNDEIVKLYGGDQAIAPYLPFINQGYQNLGQPGSDPNTGREEKTNQLVTSLASTFADRVLQKTGQLPSEDDIRQYVAQNVTAGNAQKFIQGQYNTDQMYANADQYLQDNSSKFSGAGGTPESRIMGLSDQLNKIYENSKNKFLTDTEENYGKQKTNLVNDLAGQGMLTQPNSRYSLDALEGAKNKDITGGLQTLASNQASGAVDLGKTVEDLLQKQQGINNQSSQFNRSLAANRDDTAFNQAFQNKQLSLAEQLGRAQAKSQEPGWMDYANLGLNVIGTGAKSYSATKGK